MIPARWQAVAAFGVAGVALIAGLIASGGKEDDALARYGRLQHERDAQLRAARLSLETAVPVDEPAPPEADDDDGHSLVVEVHEDTQSIGGTEMTLDQVETTFRAAFAREPSAQIVFKADPGVAHGRIVELMERAKNVGLTRLAIGTTDDP